LAEKNLNRQLLFDMMDTLNVVQTNGIGTLQETSLHASLKGWYAQPGDVLEAKVDGYFIDILRGDLLVEIQTRNFSALKRKLTRLIEKYPIRLVYPLTREKWILYEETPGGAPVRRRRSPRHADLPDVFIELVRLPELATHANFSLEVLLTHEEELRRKDGRGSWRRKGWSIIDRSLVAVVDRRLFSSPADYAALLPDGLPAPFTSADLAERLGKPRYLAQKMVYCLRKMELLSITGKTGNSLLYERGVS
jgi:hypothetical protein